MNRKHFMIATLLALVLLTVAFTPLSSQQDVREYDPWCDINDDGKIDIKDIATTAIKFGTEGDPTKNVTVTNWPEGWLQGHSETRLVYNQSVGYIPPDPHNQIYLANVNLTGYRNIAVHIKANGTWYSDTQTFIQCYWSTYGIRTLARNYRIQTEWLYLDPRDIGYGTNDQSGTYWPIASSSLDLYLLVDITPANITWLKIAVYLTN